MTSAPEVDVFAYTDYRAYLRDYYAWRKRTFPSFSYRAFSKRAKLRSPNYLKMVIDNQRKLTTNMAERFANACNLHNDHAKYFVDLVTFNQAKTSREKNDAYKRLRKSRRFQKVHTLEMAHAAYHENWWVPAIYELAMRPDFKSNPDWIAGTLRPKITETQAAKAIDTLLEIGLFKRSCQGRLERTSDMISTGAQTTGVHITNYHRTMLKQADRAIDTFPAALRDISSLTMCIGPEGFEHIKERVREFRRELMELATLEKDPSRVIQLNMQLFPLSGSKQEDSHE